MTWRGFVWMCVAASACQSPLRIPIDMGAGDVGAGRCAFSDPNACGAGLRCDLKMNTYNPVTKLGVCTPAGTLLHGAKCDDTESDPCVQGTDCQRGLCRKFCAGAGDCAEHSTVDGESLCEISPFVDGPKLCTAVCSPFLVESCPSGEFCRVTPSTTTATFTTDCRKVSPSPVLEGVACASVDDCAEGLLCTIESGAATCHRLCRVQNGDADCLPDRLCSPLSVTINGQTGYSNQYGACY